MPDEQATSSVAVAETSAGSVDSATASTPPATSESSPSANESVQAPNAATEDVDLDGFVGKLSPEKRVELVKRFDPDELIRLDDRLSGKLGALAQKQAHRQVESRLADERRRWEVEYEQSRVERDRIERLRKAADEDDPYAALDLVKQQAKDLERQTLQDIDYRRTSAVVTGVFEQWQKGLTDVFHTLPQPVKEKLAGREYGRGVEALTAFQRDMAESLAEHRAQELTQHATAKLRKELEPVLEKEILSRLNGGEPLLDTRGGGSAVGLISQDEFNRHRGDPAWMRANIDRVRQSVFRGTIRN